MQWISASQLEIWARRVTARADLPKLVADLIRASCPDIDSFRFPSGEKGQVRGFDGHLETRCEGMNVPKGTSYWEFGTDRNYKAKATEELQRVSSQFVDEQRKQLTFVFVTPWTWDSSNLANKLEDWETESCRLFGWKQVYYLDGVKLEAWLDNSPAVSSWHAKATMDLYPQEGAQSTEEFWENFAHHFKPPITEEVLLCERVQQSERLINVLMGRPDQISFSADFPDEVIAFAIAAIRVSKPEIRFFLEARTLVIDKMSAGRLMLTRSNLIYLLRGEAADAPGQFSNRGPTLVSLGRAQRSGMTEALKRPSGQAMGTALMSLGFPEPAAMTHARGCGRSILVLMRRIPSGSCKPPAWMPDRNLLLPAILLGSWDANNQYDCNVITAIAGFDSYVKYESALRSFIDREDPPLEKEGNVWKVRAPTDAFLHIGDLIGIEHLALLRTAMIIVFSRIEPEPDPKTIFRSSNRVTAHSDWLRDGLATTLLLLAVWEKEARVTLSPGEGQKFANELIMALPGLKTNYRLLASLRDELPLLAEAAPSPLLEALEHMLEGDGAMIRPLLIEVEGFLTPVAYHTGVLWALETLAWDPAFFDRTIQILARLALIDGGGRVTNRPINSLREIFLCWNPNTNAGIVQRLTALDWITTNVSPVGWQLICSLLPSIHDTSTPTARPKLREAGASDRPTLTRQDVWDSQSAIVRRAIRLAGASPARWIQLLPATTNFSEPDRTAAFDALEIAISAMTVTEKQPLWEHIRSEIAKHERFSKAVWSLSIDQLQPLRNLMRRHAPSDPIADVVWLFDTWMQDAYGNEEEANRSRLQALKSILHDFGLDGVLRLGLETKLPYKIVDALRMLSFSKENVEQLLLIAIKNEPKSDFLVSLSRLHYELVGEQFSTEWIESVMKLNVWSSDTIARLLIARPVKASTWQIASRLGQHVSDEYWRMMGAVRVEGSKFELLKAELHLLNRDQALDALRTATHRLSDTPTRMLLRILPAVAHEISTGGSHTNSIIGWELERVFEELDSRIDASDSQVAELEFSFLPFLEHGNRVLRIHKVMATDPNLYHEVLCRVFGRADEMSEKAELTEHEQLIGRLSYSLLSNFKTLPGLIDGELRSATLGDWIDAAKRLALASDREEIVDIYIGHLLAHAPQDADGGWPHAGVREQIERLDSDNIELGIVTERFNMRGAHSKGLYTGGVEERSFADQNRSYAMIASSWPRTSSMLRAIAENWDAHARHEDMSAAQRRLKS